MFKQRKELRFEGRTERREGGLSYGGWRTGGSRGTLEVDARLFCQALVW